MGVFLSRGILKELSKIFLRKSQKPLAIPQIVWYNIHRYGGIAQMVRALA